MQSSDESSCGETHVQKGVKASDIKSTHSHLVWVREPDAPFSGLFVLGYRACADPDCPVNKTTKATGRN